MTFKKTSFNVIRGVALLILKPLNLFASYVLNLIIWIADPKNNIGYEVKFVGEYCKKLTQQNLF